MPSSAWKKKTKNHALLCATVRPDSPPHIAVPSPRGEAPLWSRRGTLWWAAAVVFVFFFFFFFFNDSAPTEIYPLPLHAALPIWATGRLAGADRRRVVRRARAEARRVRQ